MRVSKLFAALAFMLWTCVATDDGLSDMVQWDPYSLTVNGSRIIIFSGEFHYQRMPVPELWLSYDIFHKYKASGFNTISVYFFWSYHSASKDHFDFETTGKSLQRLFDYAKEAGLWVIARAGPYCNAETNGGGLALWGSDGSLGNLRTSDATYHQAWLPFITKIGQIIANNEITKGGTVILNQIENELQETTYLPTSTLVLYMEQLKKAFRAAGVTVPLSHNEKGMRSVSWSTDYHNVGGAVNMYGLDSYPGGLSCTNPNSGFNVVRTYHQWFSNYSYTQPNYFPEFEGGWFSAWGGSFYDSCAAEHEPGFADVYYKNNIGQRTTLQNLYMTWGGTNWGHSASPVVYTSYDYSAPLRETRQITDKMSQTKLQGLFTRVSKDLLKTYMVGNGTGYATSSTDIWTWEIRNPDTNAGFYVVGQAKSSSRASVTFSANLNTSQGLLTVPNINLNGRQSKIMVTDYKFGNHELLYSSVDILTYGVFDVDVLVLYLQEGQVGQFALKNSAGGYTAHAEQSTFGTSEVAMDTSDSSITITYTRGSGKTVLRVNGLLQIFVLGPYLVLSVSISHGVVHVSGDNDKATTIEVYTNNSTLQTIDWNGIRLDAVKTEYGSVTANIPGAADRTIPLPNLENWRSADSLPEKSPSYDDSKWAVCDKTSTLSPVAPITKPVLFPSDYGFYTGTKIYRGSFDGQGFAAVDLTCSGGLAFGWTAWLNDILVGGNAGNTTLTTTNAVLKLPASALKATDNLLTVVPRASRILGASLVSSSSTTSGTGFKLWKIQGNAGGSANLDPVRGPMNEGGLYGERLGWPFPSFVPSSPQFDRSSPFTGINSSGIRFYIIAFHLNIDSDLDVPLGIELSTPAGTVTRVMFWINGYQFGKYISHIGPQTRFPVPPGVMNNRGLNTMASSLWAMTDDGAKMDTVKLIEYGKYQTDFNFNHDWSYLQPGWDEGRLAYA
ncbi:putative beta-galactosidase C [Amylocarpus encephaloides]|uniref:beta-galactosidase n=1 Tax=Amylocarpus encephaloides TaxID=45428 RepID=A0A9P7YF68_9HELO|nr:putative beta-galactosidase C [Amylocarpus encephaloides]